MLKKSVYLSIVLVLSTLAAYAQTTSNLWFTRSRYGGACKTIVILPNQKDLEVHRDETIQIKIKSTGPIKIGVNISGQCAVYGTEEVYLPVEPGRDYYINISVAGVRGKSVMSLEKDQEKIDALKERLTDTYIEDKDSPINQSYYANSGKSEGGSGSGTGFLVSKSGYILTNYHVIDGAINVKVKHIGTEVEKEYLAKVVATDDNNDLALLKLDNSEMLEQYPIKFDSLPYSFRFTGFETGDDVFVLGYPWINAMGEEIKLTKGIVSSKSGYQGEQTSYQISAPIQPGNSGSPVFDNNGNVIGVVNAKIMAGEGITYAIKPSFIQSLFQNSEIPFTPPNKSKMEKLTLAEKTRMISPFVYIIIAER